MKSTLAFLTAAAALALSPAQGATMFADDLSVIYADGTMFGTNTSAVTLANSTLISFERPGLNLQIDASANFLDAPGPTADLFTFGGSLFWRDKNGGAFGLSVEHASTGGTDATSYGVFGEWYAIDILTLRAKGGGLSSNIAGLNDGYYVGAGAEVYLWRNLGIGASYNYIGVTGGHVHDVEGHISWQISEDYPLAVTLGAESYGYGIAYARSFRIGLTYRFGVRGSLVGIDRLGATKYNGALPGLPG